MSPATQANHPTAPHDQRMEDAREHVQQLRAFYIHASVFAVGMAIIFIVNLATNVAAGIAGEWSAWWSGWALIGWGFGVAIHGFVVRLARPGSSTSTWEQKQINRILSAEEA